MNKSYDQGSISPKIKSVVGILGHLAGSYVDNIRNALLDLFKVHFEIDEMSKVQGMSFLVEFTGISGRFGNGTIAKKGCFSIYFATDLFIIHFVVFHLYRFEKSM